MPKRKKSIKQKRQKRRKIDFNIINIPVDLLSMIFSYLSSDHHTKILPFVCKYIKNIIKKRRQSWPSRIEFNNNISNIKCGLMNFYKHKFENVLINIKKPTIFSDQYAICTRNLEIDATDFFHCSDEDIEKMINYDYLQSLKLSCISFSEESNLINNVCSISKLHTLLIEYCHGIKSEMFNNLDKLCLRNCDLNIYVTDVILQKLNITHLESLKLCFSLAHDEIINFESFFAKFIENKTLTFLSLCPPLVHALLDLNLKYISHLKLESLMLERYNIIGDELNASDLKVLHLIKVNASKELYLSIFENAIHLKKVIISEKKDHHVFGNDEFIKLCNLNIDDLELTRCRELTSDGFNRIQKLHQLRNLTLCSCSITGRDLFFISNIQLSNLTLEDINIDDDDLKYLQSSFIVFLSLRNLHINGDGFKYLENMPYISCIRCNNITNDKLKLLFIYEQQIHFINCDNITPHIEDPKIKCTVDEYAISFSNKIEISQ